MTEPGLRLSDTTRTEAFSDGVMAIAITLLIIEVRLPSRDSIGDGRLLHELLDIWPSYLAYLTAFLTIAIIWLNHHAVFAKIRYLDKTLAWCNMGLLLAVAFLPFPTAVVAEYVREGGVNARVATAFYALLAVLMTVPWVFLWGHLAKRPDLFEPGFDAGYARKERRRAMVGVVIYSIGVLVALAVPLVALILFLINAIFYAITSQGSEAAA